MPSRASIVGDSVERGRTPGVSALGDETSSHIICARVPRQNPTSGMNGDDCNQPPEGVTEINVPHVSITSRWQVSPRVRPERSIVGSPAPAPAPATAATASFITIGGCHGAWPSGLPGRISREAVSLISAARVAA